MPTACPPSRWAEVREIVGGAPLYFTFDIDGMDPSCAPGTGVPEIGGLTSWQMMQIIRGLVGTNLVGAGNSVDLPIPPRSVFAGVALRP